MTATVVSPFLALALASNAAEFSGENRKNPGHDTFMKMNVDARKKHRTVIILVACVPKALKLIFKALIQTSRILKCSV